MLDKESFVKEVMRFDASDSKIVFEINDFLGVVEFCEV